MDNDDSENLGLLIDRDLVHKRAYLPVKLAALSYIDQAAAVQLLRDWGEGRKPITDLWNEVVSAEKGKERPND